MSSALIHSIYGKGEGNRKECIKEKVGRKKEATLGDWSEKGRFHEDL